MGFVYGRYGSYAIGLIALAAVACVALVFAATVVRRAVRSRAAVAPAARA
jgi:NNP family nitrate/nitrite transporter-like MFS transporter